MIKDRAAKLSATMVDDDASEDEEPIRPEKKVRSSYVAPAAMLRISRVPLPFCRKNSGHPDVAAFQRHLEVEGSYFLAELLRVLNDLRTGIYAGLVVAAPGSAAADAAGIAEGDRTVDSSSRSFTLKVSYLERALLAQYATLVARYTTGVGMAERNSGVIFTLDAAVLTMIPPHRVPNQGSFLRRNKYRWDNPYAQVYCRA